MLIRDPSNALERRVFFLTAALFVTLSAPAAAQSQRGATRAPEPPATVADSTRDVLVRAAHQLLASILATVPDTAPVCVSFAEGTERYRVPASNRALVSDGRRAVVDLSDCPETFATMIAYVDSFGRPAHRRPPGYVDPRYVEMLLSVQSSMFTLFVRILVSQGTEFHTYECRRGRTASDQPFACRIIEHGFR